MDRNRAFAVHALLTTVMLVLLMVGGAEAATITVNASGGAMYTRIQDAINASNNSDTIIVAAGIYNENVIVNKSVNLTGSGANVTIINASDPNSHVIYVSAQDGVNIRDFTATGGTGGTHTSRSAGIYLSRTNNTNISKNIISNNYYGIYLFSAINTNLSGNNVNSNNYGIYLMLSSNNTIYNNLFNNTNNFENSIAGINRWNVSKQTATNIVDGLNIGGNFWKNLSGTGFSQTCTDANLDGICDSGYMLSTGNEDYLPLAIPTGYINGSVKYNNTGVEGAVVATNNSVSTTTDASGFFSFQLPAGTYQLTATCEPEYYPDNSTASTVVIGTTVMAQDINLIKKPTGNITGMVRSPD
ncbi:Cell surface glycoprotein [uncultured archaeon]|nr:Cell surface glycoprotein [uncultured archaeon]